MSKGSSPRPFSVDQETFGNNFDAIFRKTEKIPGWKHLDQATRKWAVLTGHEKDQEQYEKLSQKYNTSA